MNQYNKDYYKSVNYVSYLNRKPKYVKHVHEIDSLLKSFNLISANSKILDYGCAVGFLIEGFKEAGYQNIEGYDISEWAVQQCKSKNINMLEAVDSINYDLICCLDVLEHMPDDDIINTLLTVLNAKFENINKILVTYLMQTGGGDKYYKKYIKYKIKYLKLSL